MSQQIDAIYDSGILRPLEPLALPDRARVKVTIDAQVGCEPAEQSTGVNNAQRHGDREGGGNAESDFDEELNSLLFDGPTLPPDFSRADIYTDHD